MNREELYGPLVFPVDEYRARVERAAALMDEAQLDALLLTDDRNILYFAGWGDLSPVGARARPRFLILDRQGRLSMLLHTASVTPAADMSWVEDIRPYHLIRGAPAAEVATWLGDLGLSRGRLGLELGYEQRLDLSIDDFQSLGTALPGVELADAADLLWQLRLVKSPAEVDRIRRACQITSRTYDRLFPKVEAGMTEIELAGLFQRSAAAEGAQASACFVLAGRGRYGRGNAVATAAPVQIGEMVWFDGGANIGGYRADFSRAGVIGGPSDHQRRLHDGMAEVVARVVAEIGPGVATRDLARRCDEELARRGLVVNSGSGRHGHGLGLLVTEPPHVALHDDTVLEPGMVITIEPGCYDDEGRYHVEDDVLVTASGHEILTECERSLRTL